MWVIRGLARILGMMFLIMFGLKIAGIATISWWVATAPLWVVPSLMTLMFLFFYTYGVFSKKDWF